MDQSLCGLPATATMSLTTSHLAVGDMKMQRHERKNAAERWEASHDGNFVGAPVSSSIGYETRRGGIVVPRHTFLYDVLGTDTEEVVTVLGKLKVVTQWEYVASLLPTPELLAQADAAAFRHRQGTIASGLPDHVFYNALRGLRNPY